VTRTFEQLFERAPALARDAPGRVNLIGEHTDYNGGFVLPAVIPQRTRVELATRDDSIVRVSSENVEAGRIFSFELGRESRTGHWSDYVQGTVVALRDAGFEVRGFDARLSSEIPSGSGLSSSAALEVSLLRALSSAFELELSDLAIARIGQRAENDFVGAPVGIMDQMASSAGTEGTALFIDTRTLEFERIPIPDTIELVVIDSGVSHAHASGEYRVRRQQCQEAASRLGVRELRDVLDPGAVAALPPPLERRARHVVAENARVLRFVELLSRGDVDELGPLLIESHASLRDDFEVSTPDVDRLVAVALQVTGVLGARMTGGGFGGSIVALVRRGSGRDAAAQIRAEYDAGGTPRARVLVPISMG
jgi:galactokinase